MTNRERLCRQCGCALLANQRRFCSRACYDDWVGDSCVESDPELEFGDRLELGTSWLQGEPLDDDDEEDSL